MWEWSYTVEGQDNIANNIRSLDRETMEVVYAEWEGQTGSSHAIDLDMTKYNRALKRAKTLDTETLSDYIIGRAAEQATCTNGAWEAYICPFGCHTVTPDTED